MKQLATNKRGNLDNYQGFLTALALGVAVLVVVGIILQGFLGNSATTCAEAGDIFNATANQCQNPSNVSDLSGKSYAGNISTDGLTFMANVTDQFGTAGTVLGVSLLLVVIGALGLWGYKKWSDM